MANYSITNGSTAGGGTQQNVASAYTQATIAITNSTANGATTAYNRGKVYDILVGTNNTPGDTFVEWDLSRCTASSTSTFVTTTSLGLDTADAGANALVVVNSSQHSTISVPNVWYIGMNQRASYRWVAAPGSEIVWPTTASNGVVLRPRGSYTSTVTANVMWQQQ